MPTYHVWRIKSGNQSNDWGGGKFNWLYSDLPATSPKDAVHKAAEKIPYGSTGPLVKDGDVLLIVNKNGGHDQVGIFSVEVKTDNDEPTTGLPVEKVVVRR